MVTAPCGPIQTSHVPVSGSRLGWGGGGVWASREELGRQGRGSRGAGGTAFCSLGVGEGTVPWFSGQLGLCS